MRSDWEARGIAAVTNHQGNSQTSLRKSLRSQVLTFLVLTAKPVLTLPFLVLTAKPVLTSEAQVPYSTQWGMCC